MSDSITRADLTEALTPILTRLDRLETGQQRLEGGQQRLEASYQRLETSYQRLEAGYQRLEARADKTEQTLERLIALTLETRLTLIEEIRAEIRGRFNTADARFDSTTQQLETVRQEQMLERHAHKRLQRRVRRLERHTGLQP